MALARIAELSETTSFILALLAITWCFSGWSVIEGDMYTVSLAFAAALTSFLPHELAHRAMARRYGCFSRFILDPMGLILTIVSGILPIKIVFPGYVLISIPYYDPRMSRYIEGVSATVGPIVNIAVASIAYLIMEFTFLNPLIMIALWWIARLNAWIGFFNLLPIPPLDGSKIVRWRITVWLPLFIVSIILLKLTEWLWF